MIFASSTTLTREKSVLTLPSTKLRINTRECRNSSGTPQSRDKTCSRNASSKQFRKQSVAARRSKRPTATSSVLSSKSTNAKSAKTSKFSRKRSLKPQEKNRRPPRKSRLSLRSPFPWRRNQLKCLRASTSLPPRKMMQAKLKSNHETSARRKRGRQSLALTNASKCTEPKNLKLRSRFLRMKLSRNTSRSQLKLNLLLRSRRRKRWKKLSLLKCHKWLLLKCLE